MKDMMKTANGLDKFLNVMFVLLKVIMIFMVVGLCIIPSYFLFDLEPYLVGTGFEEADFGFLTFTVAEAYLPNHSYVVLAFAGELLAAIAVCFFCRKLVACFRKILAPMKEGIPFQNTVSTNLKAAAKHIIVLGIIVNIAQVYEDTVIPFLYGLPKLMLSDKITHVAIHYDFDLTFLIFSAVLLLLSYVFRYGEELQQLSDETV